MNVDMTTLMTIGGFMPLPYVFYEVIQSVRHHRQINFLGMLLALIAVILPAALITWRVLTGMTEPLLTVAALASAAIMLVFSLIVTLRDARQPKPDRAMSRSYGLLGMALAVLIAVGVIALPRTIPLIPGVTITAQSETAASDRAARFAAFQRNQSEQGAQPTSEPGVLALTANDGGSSLSAPNGFNISAPNGFSQNVATGGTPLGQGSAEATPNAPAIALPNAPAGFAMPTFAAPPTPEPTAIAPTPEQARVSFDDFATQVMSRVGEVTIDTAAAALSQDVAQSEDTSGAASADTANASDVTQAAAAPTCVIAIDYNLNLRADPSKDGELLLTIPFGSAVSSTGHNADDWWQVSYDGKEGWVSGEYVSLTASCNALAELH